MLYRRTWASICPKDQDTQPKAALCKREISLKSLLFPLEKNVCVCVCVCSSAFYSIIGWDLHQHKHKWVSSSHTHFWLRWILWGAAGTYPVVSYPPCRSAGYWQVHVPQGEILNLFNLSPLHSLQTYNWASIKRCEVTLKFDNDNEKQEIQNKDFWHL